MKIRLKILSISLLIVAGSLVTLNLQANDPPPKPPQHNTQENAAPGGGGGGAPIGGGLLILLGLGAIYGGKKVFNNYKDNNK